MDKLLWPVGGVELHADDFIFAEQAIRDAFKGVLSGLQAPNQVLILSGCDVSIAAGTATITEGWVSYNNETLYMPAHTTSTQSGGVFLNKVYITLSVTLDATGDEVLASGSTGQTYQRRRALCTAVPTSGVESFRESVHWVPIARRISDLTAAGAEPLSITASDLTSAFGLATGYQVALKKVAGSIKMRGSLITPGMSANTLTLAFTLPVGFRPTITKHIAAIVVQENTSYVFGSIHIETNGNVSFLAATANPESLYFDVVFA